jgi:hypothetical protein
MLSSSNARRPSAALTSTTLTPMSRRTAYLAVLLPLLVAPLVVALSAAPAQAQARFASGAATESASEGLNGILPEARGGGMQEVRVRLVQDDGVVGGVLKVAVEVRTEGLTANTFGSATIDLLYDDTLLTPSSFESGILTYPDTPYSVDPEPLSGFLRLTITSVGVGDGGFDLDGYEVASAFEPLITYVFTIDQVFDEADFLIDCTTLSVGYYETVDNSNDSGEIDDNTTGAVPMASVRPLALRTFSLSAAEGWRVLSGLPGMRVDDLLGPLTTQGFTGADQAGFANVWWWFESTGWSPAGSQSEGIPATAGVAFYALAVDGGTSARVAGTALDQGYDTPTRTCSAFPLGFDVSYTTTSPPTAGPGWNLEGNPTAYTLDWKAGTWTRTNVDEVAYVYDAETDQYLTNNGSTGTFDGLIAPLQGFWVHATGSAPSLVAPEAALTTGGTFYGRSAPLAVGRPHGGLDVPKGIQIASANVSALSTNDAFSAAKSDDARRAGLDTMWSARGPVVALRLEGEVQGVDRWAAAHVSFQAGGEPGLDRYDARALAGLGARSLDLFTVLDDGTALEIDARPVASLNPDGSGGEGALEIPLAVEATVGDEAVGGKFTLALTKVEGLPANVRPVLVDTETGVEVDLSAVEEYLFEVVATPPLKGEATVRLGEQAVEGRVSSVRTPSGEALGSDRGSVIRGRGVQGEAPGVRFMPVNDPISALGSPAAQRGEAGAARFLLRLERAEGATRSASNAGKAGGGASGETKPGDGLVAARGTGASLPDAYALESAYPNPFARRATVRYALPEAAEVRLAAYDLLGRRVAVLAEGSQTAGYHTVGWDASGLPSGVYVLRLTAGEHAFTERITLVR